jgi:phosphatidylserine decarboxylase
MNSLGLDILNPYFILLLFAGLMITTQLHVPQIRYLFLSLKILSGNMDFKGSRGQLIHSQAFFAGIGSSLLLGSFFGTTLAILVGGLGTLLWIWVTAILIMPLRLVSSTLAIKFRTKLPSGRYLAGPMYFIEKALRAKWLAVVFALASIFVVLSLGSLLPSTILTYIAHESFGWEGMVFPFVLSVVVVFIVLGGIRRIGRSAGVIASIALILFFPAYIFYISQFESSFFSFLGAVWNDAWHPSSGGGNIRYTIGGVALFYLATETGIGKSSGVSGVVRTDFPAKQGLVSMLATFFESFIFATLTGFALYGFGLVQTSGDQISLATFQNAFSSFIQNSAGISGHVIMISFLMFGLVSVCGWFYTGEQNAYYISGDRFANLFRIIFIACLLAGPYFYIEYHEIFLIPLIKFSFLLAVMAAVPLIISLVLLTKMAKFEVNKYVTESNVRYEVWKDFYLLVLTLLPKNLISKIFGIISMARLPRFVMIPVLRAFAKAYKINLDEAEYQLSEYNSLNQFFTRSLRAGARIIDSAENGVVSPVDAKVTAMGDISEKIIIQAKGIDYNLKELLGSEKYLEDFTNGKFITFYLSPQDYHRIHSPFYGRILGYYYEPGKLFPVNDLAVLNIKGLFPKNERLITFLQTEYGKIAVIKVGASNVGKIRVTYDNKIVTNSWIRFSKDYSYEDVSIMIDKGSELGRFEMGSTVILLFEKDSFDFGQVALNEKIQYGAPVGLFRSKKMNLPK